MALTNQFSMCLDLLWFNYGYVNYRLCRGLYEIMPQSPEQLQLLNSVEANEGYTFIVGAKL